MHAHLLGVGPGQCPVKVEVTTASGATRSSAPGIIIYIDVPIISGAKGKSIVERVVPQIGLIVAAVGACRDAGSNHRLSSSLSSGARRAPLQQTAPMAAKAIVCELVGGRQW